MDLLMPIPNLFKLLEWEWTFGVQLWEHDSIAEVMESDFIFQQIFKIGLSRLAYLFRCQIFLDQYVCFRPKNPKSLIGSHSAGQVYFSCILLKS